MPSTKPPLRLYACCDFTLASELELPHGSIGTGEMATAWIHFHDVDPDLGADGQRGFQAHAKPGRFLFQVEGVARFLIRDGKEILIDPAPGAEADSLRAFLLSTALAALLLQRGFLVLNGGAVTREGEAVALIGTAGSGRSTMLTAMQRQGWSILSDEICAVKTDGDGKMAAWPIYPSISLWQDTLDRHGLPWALMRPLRPGLSKYTLALENASGAVCPLTHLVELKQSNTAFANAAIAGMERLVPLLEHASLSGFLGTMEVRNRHLHLAAKLIRQASFHTANRPRGVVDEAAFLAQIMAGLTP